MKKIQFIIFSFFVFGADLPVFSYSEVRPQRPKKKAKKKKKKEKKRKKLSISERRSISKIKIEQQSTNPILDESDLPLIAEIEQENEIRKKFATTLSSVKLSTEQKKHIADIAKQELNKILQDPFTSARFNLFGGKKYKNVLDFFNTIITTASPNPSILINAHENELRRGVRFLEYQLAKAFQEYSFITYKRAGKTTIDKSFYNENNLITSWNQLEPTDQAFLSESGTQIILNLSVLLQIFDEYLRKIGKTEIEKYASVSINSEKCRSFIVLCRIFGELQEQFNYIGNTNLVSNTNQNYIEERKAIFKNFAIDMNLAEIVKAIHSHSSTKSLNWIADIVFIEFLLKAGFGIG